MKRYWSRHPRYKLRECRLKEVACTFSVYAKASPPFLGKRKEPHEEALVSYLLPLLAIYPPMPRILIPSFLLIKSWLLPDKYTNAAHA